MVEHHPINFPCIEEAKAKIFPLQTSLDFFGGGYILTCIPTLVVGANMARCIWKSQALVFLLDAKVHV